MAFTRDWLSSWILDHSKFKTQPGYVRGLMDDVGERLSAYLYGFTSGETFTGFKKVGLISIGTGPGTIPTGTGPAVAINLQGKTFDGKVELITIDADGNEIQLTSKGNRLPNNTWFKATNAAGNAGINILKVNTGNQIEIGTSFGTHLVGPDTGPTTDLQYAPKGYVDNAINPTKAAVNSRILPLSSSQAVGAGTQAGSGAEQDMTSMTTTFTTYGTRMLVMFSGDFTVAASTLAVTVYINIDGSNKQSMTSNIYSASQCIAFQHLEIGLTPGAHTVKIRWNALNTMTVEAARILTCIDLD